MLRKKSKKKNESGFLLNQPDYYFNYNFTFRQNAISRYFPNVEKIEKMAMNYEKAYENFKIKFWTLNEEKHYKAIFYYQLMMYNPFDEDSLILSVNQFLSLIKKSLSEENFLLIFGKEKILMSDLNNKLDIIKEKVGENKYEYKTI